MESGEEWRGADGGVCVGESDPEYDSGSRGAQAGRCEHLAWGGVGGLGTLLEEQVDLPV